MVVYWDHMAIYFLALVLVGIFFSYAPTISFGSSMGTNFEISITQITIVLFIISSIALLFKQRSVVIKNRTVQLLIAYSLIATISLIWTANLTRGILFVGLSWVITALWCSVVARKQTVKTHSTKLATLVLCTTLAVCGVAWFQVFGDAIGLPTTITLLPLPYVSDVFGFARPTAFALEPQFLGSLLLAPILYAVHKEVDTTATMLTRIVLFVAFATLIATISRGAFVAFIIGLALLSVSIVVTKNYKSILKIAGITGLSMVVSIMSLALATSLNTRNDITGAQAVAKAVNHVSLGVITINADPSSPVPAKTGIEAATPATNDPQPTEGYVAESTNSRLLMSQEAIKMWTSSPFRLLFGVGVGGFGATLHAQNPVYAPSSIVNNQYLEVLAENGMIGLLAFVAIFASILVVFWQRKKWLYISLLAAYLAQWLFFSGNVNVLHIWVVLALACVLLSFEMKKQTLNHV